MPTTPEVAQGPGERSRGDSGPHSVLVVALRVRWGGGFCWVGRSRSVIAEVRLPGGYRVKIESVRIENFRAFKDETIPLRNYVCLVGQNGSGKSTVLHALNVFFRQSRDSQTDLTHLGADDFHHRNTDSPIRITVTFTGLSDGARADLKDYVRQGKLVVSAVAAFNPKTETAELKQVGSRLGIKDFRQYFEAEKGGMKAPGLKLSLIHISEPTRLGMISYAVF